MATKPTSLPSWATSTGSTIVGSLVATSAVFQNTVTQGGANYGQIKFTFSGSPSFASVIVGHKLTISGMAQILNNFSNAYIYAVDNTAKTIDVLLTSRLDATADETGASGTGTVTDAGAIIQEPTTAKKAQGFLTPQLPNDGSMNWFNNLVYQWCNYLDGFVSGAIEINQAHTFVVGDVVYVNSGTWADAQGNAIATSTNCYLVIEVTDSSNFTVAKEGRRTWTAHGLTANTTYYLDPDTAAGLVATKPIGNTSRPLGYYLPVLRVVDSNTVDLVIPVEPVFNPVYAEYISTSDGTDLDRTFTNLSSQNVGGIIDVSLTCKEGTGTVSSVTFTLGGIPSSTAYDDIQFLSTPLAKSGTSNTDEYTIARTTTSSGVMSSNFTLQMSNSIVFVHGSSINSNEEINVFAGNIVMPADLTDITNFDIYDIGASNDTVLEDGDFIRLMIRQMPVA
jgi:hypothetical protein